MSTALMPIRLLSAMFAILLLGPDAQMHAQTAAAPQNVDGALIRDIHPIPTPTPIPFNVHTPTVPSLQFLAPDSMTAADRSLAADNEAEIARRAALQGFALQRETGWGFEQAICPVFPNQLILEYSRQSGPADVTLFSVAIPRGTAQGGHVRVIPVRRRSYSLWTPAASNALTLNDFNHLVSEDGKGLAPDWLTLGLCYTALAGGHVRAELVPSRPADETYPLFAPAMLSVSGNGGAEIRIVDVSHYADPKARAMQWELTFAQHGRLVKVEHKVADEAFERPLAPTPTEKPVPVKGQAIQLSKSTNSR